MSDARAEDRDRLFGQPVKASHSDGFCAGCGKRILQGEDIFKRDGSWLHYEGTCVDEFEAKLQEADAA